MAGTSIFRHLCLYALSDIVPVGAAGPASASQRMKRLSVSARHSLEKVVSGNGDKERDTLSVVQATPRLYLRDDISEIISPRSRSTPYLGEVA